MRWRDPLVFPLAALMAGIAGSRVLPGDDARTLALAATGLILLACAAGKFVSARTGIGCLLTAIALGGAWLDHRQRRTPPPEIDFAPGETMVLEGCVMEPPSMSDDREQLVIELDRGARVRVNFYLREGETAPDVHYGQRIELEARLRRPRNYLNPGAFDFKAYLARRDIYWLGTANGRSAWKILAGACGQPLLAVLYRSRERLTRRLDQMFAGDDYSAGMSRALLVGDTAKLERVWTEEFRRTGTYHALVISGLHLTMLAACFLFLFQVAGVNALASLAVTAALCWAYALLTGGGTPVIRAAAGLTLFVVARFLFRRPRIVNLLAAVAIVFLAADPGQLFEPSFQLSFLAVALIGALALPWLEQTTEPYRLGFRALANTNRDPYLPPRVAAMRLEFRLIAETLRWKWRIPPAYLLPVMGFATRFVLWMWSAFVISAVVQAGMTLPMAVYFHRVSLSGLTANLVVTPVLNSAVVLGLAAVATGWQFLAAPVATLLHLSRTIVSFHAGLGAEWRVPDPPLWLTVAFLGALVLAAVAVRRETRYRLAGAVALLISLVLVAWQPFPTDIEAGKLEVTMIDVGQGEAMLVVTPEGKTMLVDAGGFPSFGKRRASTFDVGEEVVSAYLFARGIRRVDIIAVTHAHEDHVGGLRALTANFAPGEIWTGAWPAGARGLLTGLKVPVRSPLAGDRIRLGGAAIEVLSPPRGYEPSATPSNNDSLAMRISFGGRSLLLTGDMERPMEERLLEDGAAAPADVLKVAHHGSRTSTAGAFLDTVKPAIAVISDGEGNQFNHPHPDVVRRLEERGVAVWRTDRHGLIRIVTDGRRLFLEPYAWTVAPSAWHRPRAW